MHGPIQPIDYQVSRIQLDPPFAGAAIGDLFIVVQDGVLYWTPVDGATSFSNQTWLGAAALLLTPADFTPAGLDFSDTGGEMRFGPHVARGTGRQACDVGPVRIDGEEVILGAQLARKDQARVVR